MGWMQMAGQKDFGGFRLLIAEDNTLYGEMMTELLTMYHAKVRLAKNGVEALRLLRESTNAFDAVLMDVLMPGMNGYETTRAIRRLDKAHNGQVPVLAMTAGTDESIRRRAREAGMDAFLGKPVEVAALDEALGRVLREKAV